MLSLKWSRLARRPPGADLQTPALRRLPQRPSALPLPAAGPVPADPRPAHRARVFDAVRIWRRLRTVQLGSREIHRPRRRVRRGSSFRIRHSAAALRHRGGSTPIAPSLNETYRMTCTGSGVVTCKGGNNAVVYLY